MTRHLLLMICPTLAFEVGGPFWSEAGLHSSGREIFLQGPMVKSA